MTVLTKIFYYRNTENELKLSQQDKLSKFCMDAGFLFFARELKDTAQGKGQVTSLRSK